MTHRKLIFLTMIVLASFSGCTDPTATNAVRQLNRDAERTGSPDRYRANRVPGGGTAMERYRIVAPTPCSIPDDLQPTSANADLQKDIRAKIALIEQGWDSTATPVLLGVQRIASSDGSIKETWFVRQGKGAVRYDVTLTPSTMGGTDFSVTGPLE
jgi:hypothetical protein